MKATPTALPSPVILNVLLFASTVAVSALPLKLVANISFNFKPALTNEELAASHIENSFWAKD